MEKLINCLDLRNGQIICNGEEFMALTVAINEPFKYVFCEWTHLNNFAKKRFCDAYKVKPSEVKYATIVKTSFSNYSLVVQLYDLHNRPSYTSIVHADKTLSSHYSFAAIKLAENEN